MTETVELTYDELGTLEYDLKKDLIKYMVSIQRSRAKGEVPNQGTLRDYKTKSRALMKIQNAQRQQTYKDIPDMHVFAHDLWNVDFEGSKTLHEIVETLHKTGNEPVVC